MYTMRTAIFRSYFVLLQSLTRHKFSAINSITARLIQVLSRSDVDVNFKTARRERTGYTQCISTSKTSECIQFGQMLERYLESLGTAAHNTLPRCTS